MAQKKKPLPKRIVGRLLRLIASRPQGRPKLKVEEPKRILLMRYDRLGDMVITTPLIETLHTIAPQAQIDVLASWRNAELIEHDPRIHQVYRWDGSLIKRIRTLLICRKQNYDITFQLLLWRTTLPGLLAGLLTPHGRVVSRDDSNNRELFDHTYNVISTIHYSEQVYGFLSAGFEIQDELPPMPSYSLSVPPHITTTSVEQLHSLGLRAGRYLLLNLSAGETRRELSTQQNVQLIQGIMESLEQSSLKNTHYWKP